MQNSRDSSVWRTLAVAFGDGLAFGVGVTLTRGAARIAANRSATPAIGPPAGAQGDEWSREVRQRAGATGSADTQAPRASANSLAMETALAGINRRVADTGSQIDRRLSELEGRIRTELDALDDQDHALAEGVETRIEGLRGEISNAVAEQRQTIDAEMRNLRNQMATLHKEFAETLGRVIDEQIARTVDAKMRLMEQDLRAALREEVEGQARQVAEVREIVEAQDRDMRTTLHSLGEALLRVAGAGSEAESEDAPQDPADAELPAFARSRPRKPLWRLPVVSSFVAATGGLVLMHYR